MKNNVLTKILSLIIILALMFTSVINAMTFKDISDHWAKNYIEKVAANGLVSGYDGGLFKPENNVTVLEALVMLSRLHSIDEDIRYRMIQENKSFLKGVPNTSGYEWSFEYLSVIIELGIVSADGIKDMFNKKTIFEAASKEEIAILLTKAMMLEDEAKGLKSYTLPFNDVAKIATAARPYIYVMYDKGIVQGDNERNINPKINITRAVMATMLDRAYEYINEKKVEPNLDKYISTKTISGILTEASKVNTESVLYLMGDDNTVSTVKINNDTKIYLNSRLSDSSKLKNDMLVSCKVNDENIALTVEADNITKVERGTIYYVAYTPPAAISIKKENSDKSTFNVSKSAKVFLDGKETLLKNLKDDDRVTLLIRDDEVYQINSVSRVQRYDGKITNINYSAFPIIITIKTDSGKELKLEYTSDVEITRNDEESSFDQVRIGDEVNITTKYNKLTYLNTNVTEAETSGTIREILIAPQNKIKIADKDGYVKEYLVSKNVKIYIGKKSASIYDLRLGYFVDVNTFGDEIVTMEASQLETAKNFSGKVIYTNMDDGLIMIQDHKDNGQTELINIRLTRATKIFSTTGSTKYAADITEGINVIGTAITQGGEYIAISIIIQ